MGDIHVFVFFIINYFVTFYLHYVTSFHYLCNIKLNIMTTNNETNNTMKDPIIEHIINITTFEVHDDKLKVHYMTTQCKVQD